MDEAQREILDVDVLFVGAGPASLAGAWRLGQLLDEHNATAETPMELSIAVLEKGLEIGSHAISGAVVDPRALQELDPEGWQNAPFEGPVANERLLWLTRGRSLPFPIIPPPLRNHGKYVASLGKLLKWMAEKTEESGADIFCEFPARHVLLDGDRVIGVRTGDRGVDKQGNRKANFEPGVDVHAKVTVLGEGPRGTLVKQLDERLGLTNGRNPQTYGIGIKEIWKLPAGRIGAGDVIHTMGRPLDMSTFGGGFLYGMRDDHLIVGLVVGLDYEDPMLDPHALFQDFKRHPAVARLLADAELVGYGAKAIPEGGWWAMPRNHGHGFLLVGDSGGFLNSQRLKGIHLAMKSGMLAAETVFEALRDGEATTARLARFENKVAASWIRDELWPVRNFHQSFEHGTLAGMFQAGIGMVTGGRGWGIFNRLQNRPGHERMRKLDGKPPVRHEVTYDEVLTFDRLADVFTSGTTHEEDQPVHLLVADTDICHGRCVVEYDNPCQRFCPAAVYEMVEDGTQPHGKRLQINASNCVHCKTCDIADPYQIITWVPPEGGGGPNYSRM